MKKSLAYRLLTLFFLGVVFRFTFLNTLHCQELITLDARMTQDGVLIGGENHYGRVDLLTPFLEAKQENDRFRRLLGSLKESSLLVSHPQGPVLRWHCVSHHGGTLYCQRIQDDTLYDKEFFNTFGLTDPFDTTIDQNPDHYPDTLIVRKRPLTAAERETMTTLLSAVHNENHHGTVGQRFGTSPTLYHFEYILDGHYYHFSAILNFDDSPDEPTPSVKALMKWVSTLLE